MLMNQLCRPGARRCAVERTMDGGPAEAAFHLARTASDHSPSRCERERDCGSAAGNLAYISPYYPSADRTDTPQPPRPRTGGGVLSEPRRPARARRQACNSVLPVAAARRRQLPSPAAGIGRPAAVLPAVSGGNVAGDPSRLTETSRRREICGTIAPLGGARVTHYQRGEGSEAAAEIGRC